MVTSNIITAKISKKKGYEEGYEDGIVDGVVDGIKIGIENIMNDSSKLGKGLNSFRNPTK